MIAERIAVWSGLPLREQGPAMLVSLGHFGTHCVAATLYVALPWIQRDLDISFLAAGSLVSVFHLSAFAANFASGAICDVTGRRILMQTMSLALGACALAAASLTHGFLGLALMVVIIGATNNAWHPPAIAFLSALYPRNRGYALAIHSLGANAGDTVAPLLIGLLLGVLTWQGTMVATAVPMFALAIVLLVLLGRHDHEVIASAPGRAGLSQYGRALRTLVSDRIVLGLACMSGLRTAAQQGLFVFVPLYLAQVLNAGPFVTGLGFAAMQAGAIVFAPIVGAWSDRVGRRRIVLAGYGSSTVVIALLTLAGNEVSFVLGVTLLGLLLFAVRPVVHGWMMDIAPPAVAGAMTSVVFGTQSLFSIAVPVIGGAVADAYGVSAVFPMLAGLILVSNLIVWRLPESRERT